MRVSQRGKGDAHTYQGRSCSRPRWSAASGPACCCARGSPCARCRRGRIGPQGTLQIRSNEVSDYLPARQEVSKQRAITCAGAKTRSAEPASSAQHQSVTIRQRHQERRNEILFAHAGASGGGRGRAGAVAVGAARLRRGRVDRAEGARRAALAGTASWAEGACDRATKASEGLRCRIAHSAGFGDGTTKSWPTQARKSTASPATQPQEVIETAPCRPLVVVPAGQG